MSAHRPRGIASHPGRIGCKWSWSPAATSHADSTKQAVKEHDEEKVALDKVKDQYNNLVTQDQDLRVKIAATNKLLFALMQEAGLVPEYETEESMDLKSDAVADIIEKAMREKRDNLARQVAADIILIYELHQITSETEKALSAAFE